MALILKTSFCVLLQAIVLQEVTSVPLGTSVNSSFLRKQGKREADFRWIKPDNTGSKESWIQILWDKKKEEEDEDPSDREILQDNGLIRQNGNETEDPRLRLEILDANSRIDSRKKDGISEANEGGVIDRSIMERRIEEKLINSENGKSNNNLKERSNEDGCVPLQLIWPCACATDDNGDVTITCYNAQGPDMVQRALLPDYPSPNMKGLRILQSNLGLLPKDILNGKSFEEMDLYGSGLQGLEEGAFAGCQSTLKIIRLNSNHLKNFTFGELPNFPLLEFLGLGDNQLTSIDGFVGLPPLAMTTLYMGGNHIATLHPEVFYSLPNLTLVDLSFNDISFIPPGVFLPLTHLESLELKGNSIVHLSTGAFWFSTPVLMSMNIQRLGLKTLDPDVFRGVDISTQVSLGANHLRHIHYDTFGSLLRNVSTGYGWLDVAGSWLYCDCDVFWILQNEQMLSRLYSATCNNFTYLADLDYDAMADECAPGPMSMALLDE